MCDRGVAYCDPCEDGCDNVLVRATAKAKIHWEDEWMAVRDECLEILQEDWDDLRYEPL